LQINNFGGKKGEKGKKGKNWFFFSFIIYLTFENLRK
jgi:hypothetical protein